MAITTYCTPEQVASYLNLSQAGQTTFNTSTTPTSATVNFYILRAEEEINRYTMDSWKEERTPDYEYLESEYIRYTSTGVRFQLDKYNIVPLDAASGDALEVWDGQSYEDWLATKTEGRNEDYWLEYRKGWLFIRTDTFVRPLKVRIKYRWNGGARTLLHGDATSSATSIGILSDLNFPKSSVAKIDDEYIHYGSITSATMTSISRGLDSTTAAAHTSGTAVTYVPLDIQRACIMLTAANLLEFEDRTVIVPEFADGNMIRRKEKHDILREKAQVLLSRHVRPVAIKRTFDIHTLR